MLDQLTQQVQTITANTTVTVSGPGGLGLDLVVIGAAAAQLTTGVTLYAAAGNFAANLQSRLTNPGQPGSGGRLRIRNDSAFAQPITAAAGNTIYGGASIPPRSFVDLYCDGISSWYVGGPVSVSLTTAQVTLSTANITGMYAAPVSVIAAPGANSIIRLRSVVGKVVFNANAFANGGAFILQYDNTVHGAGINAASGTIAAAIINGGANQLFTLNGAAYTGGAATGLLNKAIYASNATGAFDTGDGSVVLTISYEIVTP